MKTLLLVFTLLALAHFSHQKTKFEDCSEDALKELMRFGDNDFDNKCQMFTCDGSGFSAVGCAPSACRPGHEIGYKEEDNSKVYPDCCGHPICDKQP